MRNYFEKFVELELDARDRASLALLRDVAQAWIANRVPNQPIRMDHCGRRELDRETFAAGLAVAKTWWP